MVYARRYRRRRRFGRTVRRRARKPWRMRRRRRYWRRPRGRARSLRNGTVQVPSMSRLPMYLPDRVRVAMKYTKVMNFDPAAGGTAQRVFRLTAPVDPDYTDVAVGPAASGWGLWTEHYRRYSVINATFIFTYVDNGGTQSYTLFTYVHPDDPLTFTGAAADVNDLRPGVTRKIVQPGQTERVPYIKKKIPIKAWVNKTWADRATIVSNVPANDDNVYLTCGVYPTDLSTDPSVIDCKVTIYFDVLLFGLEVPTSTS